MPFDGNGPSRMLESGGITKMNTICVPHDRGKIIRFAGKKSNYHLLVKLMIIPTVLFLVLIVPFMTEDYETVWDMLQETTSGRILVVASQILFVTSLSAFVWRLILVMMYRPAEACSDGELPTCTVIVPAYNEGRQVFETIQSIASSDYPVEKLSIIAVDDGSTDDTWHWIQSAVRAFPDRVLIRR
jgi:hyaluronan synthase